MFLMPCMHRVCDNHADQTFEKLKRDRPIVCAFCKQIVKYIQQQTKDTPEKYPVSADFAKACLRVTEEALPQRFQHYAKTEEAKPEPPVVEVTTAFTQPANEPEEDLLSKLQQEQLILQALHEELTAHCAQKQADNSDNINNGSSSSIAREASPGASRFDFEYFTAQNNNSLPLVFSASPSAITTSSAGFPIEFFQAGDLTNSTEDLTVDNSFVQLPFTRFDDLLPDSLPDFKFPAADFTSALPSITDQTTLETDRANMLHSHRLSDPFNDHQFRSPETLQYTTDDIGRGDYSHNNMSFASHEATDSAATGSPARRNTTSLSTDHVRTASELSELIKRGTVDSVAPPLGGRHSSHSSLSSMSLTKVGNIVNHSGLLMVDAIPDPPFFDDLREGNAISVEDVLNHVPLVEPCRQLRPSKAGVIIVKNIPYATLKNEIIAAIGRNAKIVSQPPGTSYHAIHIIMERASGKTMDAFVEVETHNDAVAIVDVFNQRVSQRRGPRIGNRHVEIEVSSQAQLMQTLFPRARSMTWQGQEPCVDNTGDEFSSGFLGFLTQEEITMLVKHAEVPQRSPFAQRCLHRTYESIISTLWKYPWFAPELITVKERVMLFEVACGLLKALMRSLRGDTTRQSSSANLNIELLQELCCAVFNVPFSAGQKDYAAAMMTEYGFEHVVDSVRRGNLGPFADSWPFEALDKTEGVSFESMQYYVGLLCKSSPAPQLSLAQRSMLGRPQHSTSPFGLFTIDYATPKLGDLVLADVAQYEWNAVEVALRKALRSESQSLIENLENLALTHDQESMSRGRSASDFIPVAIPNNLFAHKQEAVRTVSASTITGSPERHSQSPSTPPRRGGQGNPHLSPAQQLMIKHRLASAPIPSQQLTSSHASAVEQAQSPLMWQLQAATQPHPQQAVSGALSTSPSSSSQGSDGHNKSAGERQFSLHGLGHGLGVSPPKTTHAGNPSTVSTTSSTHSFHTAYSEGAGQKGPTTAGISSMHDPARSGAAAQKTPWNPAAAEFSSPGLMTAQSTNSKKATLNPSAATFSSDFSTWGPIGSASGSGQGGARSWADAARGPK
ncbi:hypothetical protein MBLNU457_3323t3 [Dothideomycetes sp. NU457]